MLASQKGNYEFVNLLLDHGGFVNQSDKSQQTALFYAIDSEGDNVDVVKSILKKGKILFNLSI
jgi:ankyrin repeat protein